MGCLIRLAASPGLREKLFMCALGATAHCDDRVSLSWNNMRVAEMAYKTPLQLAKNFSAELMRS